MRRILFDIEHPAHVHLFKYAMHMLMERSHRIFIVARDKDITLRLLRLCGFHDFLVLSRVQTGAVKQIGELLVQDFRLWRHCIDVRPDILIGTSIAITHVSKLLRAKSVIFHEDDFDILKAIYYLSFPFADCIVTPESVRGDFGERHVRHNSYHELAYLHPDRFTPDASVLANLGVAEGETFFIVRFVALKAAHDVGESGLSLGMRRRLVRELSRHGRIFITTEGKLLEEFRPYQIRISPEKIHDALYYATMFIGDSQTMTAEAALLGTPAIRCNTFVGRISYLEELEHKYGLTYGFLPGEVEWMFSKIVELLDRGDLHTEWQRRRERVLADKVDLTGWMVDFIERYPQGY